MRTPTVAAVLAILAPGHAPAQTPVAPGDLLPPEPPGFVAAGGTCVPPYDANDPCRWLIAFLAPAGAPDAPPAFVYAGLREGSPTDGPGRWRVTDVLALPEIPEGYLADAGLCAGPDPGRHPVAVLRSAQGVPHLTDILWTQSLERDSSRFVPADPWALICENPVP